MSSEDFEWLLNSIGPEISKKDTNYRQSISAKERLAVTLRFLASGDSYNSLAFLFKISKQAISSIVPEVCEAIIKALKNYIKYFLTVLSLLACSCGAGVLAALWPRCLGLESARGGALGALQSYYAVPDYEHFTAAVDLVQTELECCGITDARNYEMSLWQLRRLGPRGMFVPLSCCVQHRNNASYLTPAAVDGARCQEIQPNEKYRYVPGCMSKLEEWYEQQYLIFMLALFIFACFKLAVLLSTVFSCIRLKKRRQIIHSITMRTIDNSTNENIYESKFNHDDYVTKYIQPNNFYTPRVRNPRIFPNKPNEMV